jgi:outer membrane protein assembly factor BamB
MHARRFPVAPIATLWSLCFVLGCADDQPVQPTTGGPAILAVEVAANPYNALSTVVRFEVENADSVRVVYRRGDESELSTPYYPVAEGASSIATLGLYPSSLYSHRVECKGASGEAVSAAVDFATGPLPDFLANKLKLNITGTPTGGYILTGTLLRTGPDEKYVVAFDDTGRVCWYRKLDGLGAFVGRQPNGNYTAFIGSSSGYEPTFGYFVEFAPAGDIVGRYQAPAPLYTDDHELLLTPSGDGSTVHLLSYDIRRVDLTPIGGRPDARVAGHQILRYGPDGSLEFMWNAWDHLEIQEWIEEPAVDRARAEIDFDHPNALSLDRDGNYIVSFRHLAQVIKLDSRTGEIIWRLGGLNNQFTIVNDPLLMFSGQHMAHILENGHLLLFDNGLRHTPPQSRAVEYEIDTVAKTATLVWEYRHEPPIYTPFTGSVQRLAGGNTVVGFALTGIVTEVDPSGAVVWEGDMRIGALSAIVYRILKIDSLYE